MIAVHEWTWDKEHTTYTTVLSEQDLEVKFHNGFSYGTAAIRGNKALEKGRLHYWEVKMLTPIYGTDIVNNTIIDEHILTCMTGFCIC